MNSEIVFLLKNNSSIDPVDRLRGRDLIRELNARSINAQEYNENKKPDILVSLKNDLYALAAIYFSRPKYFVLDLQDDHFKRSNVFIESGKKLVKSRCKNNKYIGFFELVYLFLFKFINKMVLVSLTKKADMVITSSLSLLNVVKKYNKNSCCIPDSIDPDLYFDTDTYFEARDEIVWVGTAFNVKYLLIVNDVLCEIQKRFGVSIKIITDKKIFNDESCLSVLEKFKFKYEFIQWDEKTFVSQIATAKVAIAPLPDGAAKSSNKILTYMACGVPVVCSGSLDYRELLEEYPDSFCYIYNNEDWQVVLNELLANNDLRLKRCELGRLLVEDFTLNKIADRYVEMFSSLENTTC